MSSLKNIMMNTIKIPWEEKPIDSKEFIEKVKNMDGRMIPTYFELIPAEEKDQINALERKLDALQAQIEAMSRK